MSATINQTFNIQRQASLTNTTILLRSGPTALFGWNFINKNAAIEFVQMFDAASTGDVILGTTAPTIAIALTTGVDVATIMALNIPLAFKNGLVVACTTTETGSSAPATNPISATFLIK